MQYRTELMEKKAKVGGEGGERIKKNGIVVMMADDDFWNQET